MCYEPYYNYPEQPIVLVDIESFQISKFDLT